MAGFWGLGGWVLGFRWVFFVFLVGGLLVDLGFWGLGFVFWVAWF